MKKITLVLSMVFLTIAGAFAQIEKPVTWSYAAKKKQVKQKLYFTSKQL